MIKKSIVFFIGAMIIYSCTNTPVSKDNKDYYEISVNEEFQIDLSSNPTTGYSWRWANNQTIDIVDSISQKYVSDSNFTRKSGVGGKEIWKFKGVKSGLDSIIMKYCRPWDPSSTVDSTIIKVKVR